MNTAGQLQTIPDGGTYLCLATTNPVIWNVSQQSIDAWTPRSGTPATCGPTGSTLPDIPASDFSIDPHIDSLGMKVVSPASNGWWLTAERWADTDWTYQWFGPDGSPGPSWPSHADPASAIAGENGEVYVVAYDRSAGTKTLVRVDGAGFGQSLNAGIDPWNPFSGNLTMGHDGYLYWNNADETRTMWIMQIDPQTLTMTGRIAVDNENVWIQATDSGIVAELYTGLAWVIPYDAFSTRSGERWQHASQRSLTEDVRNSIGLDGAIAELDLNGTCDDQRTSYRPVVGPQWTKDITDLLDAPIADCSVVDVDARPDGGVVLTVRMSSGIYHLYVDTSGNAATGPAGLVRHQRDDGDRR